MRPLATKDQLTTITIAVVRRSVSSWPPRTIATAIAFANTAAGMIRRERSTTR
jgi:hypothetical protein